MDGNEKGAGAEVDEKLAVLMRNWMDKKVPLIFHLRGGNALEARLLYYTRYEYVVQPGEESAAVVVSKHAVDFIERKR